MVKWQILYVIWQITFGNLPQECINPSLSSWGFHARILLEIGIFPFANFLCSSKKLWFWALMMILFSLSCNSSVFKLTCLRWSSDEWQLFRNLLFHPLTLISLFYFENLCGSNTLLIVWEENGTVFCIAAVFRFEFASHGRSKTLAIFHPLCLKIIGHSTNMC